MDRGQNENQLSVALLLLAAFHLIFLLAAHYMQWKLCKASLEEKKRKASEALDYVSNISTTPFAYAPLGEPLANDMLTQTALRDGNVVAVPRLLLVEGDVILLRPSQLSVALLLLAAFHLIFLLAAHYMQWKLCKASLEEKKRKASEALDYVSNISTTPFAYAPLGEPLANDMLTQTALRDGNVVAVPRLLLVEGDVILLRPSQAAPCDCKLSNGEMLKTGDRISDKVEVDRDTGAAIPLDVTKLYYCLHMVAERALLPVVVVMAVLACLMRFLLDGSQSLFSTRFVFAIPSLIVLPLTAPTFFFIIRFVHRRGNSAVCDVLRTRKANDVKDFVTLFGNLTGTSFFDKKGVLSPMNPCLDKVVFFRPSDEEQSKEAPTLEIMDLSSEQLVDGSWSVDFDDPNWSRYESNLRVIGQCLLLNRCDPKFPSFLDHLSAVATTVPRTIATACRRCSCVFPQLIGFKPNASDQFQKMPNVLGFYQRQPGEAPLPGLTKHQTPLEMAYCTIHADDRSLYYHLSCQGTASLVLEACSHVWDGEQLVPITERILKSAIDFYQRHSVTGYCLALSYRAVGMVFDDVLKDRYFEVPLLRRHPRSGALARTHSIDSSQNDPFFDRTPLKTADEVVQRWFTGHVLCGMIVTQYEVMPNAVQLVDQLETLCVRFVYFSRENELRSRVFAEKLGLEAGWNCHVSLAEACSHVWDGEQLVPITERILKSAIDFYQRHSVTGYCLALSYRAVGMVFDDVLKDRYFEVPLLRRHPRSGALARTHSIDSSQNDPFFDRTPLKTADEVVQRWFTGHVLCGMIVTQYEVMPNAVQLVDQLETLCVRFVYFSRENELRSRVFAEKLGLEAGWNCHVSLAEVDPDATGRTLKDYFLSKTFLGSSPALRSSVLKHLSRSDDDLHTNFLLTSNIQGSPIEKKYSHQPPVKMAVIPNKAQLPTGIEAVRPHLEQVDNVPLLVGLITDCTPGANLQMLEIMQADVSISVLPVGDWQCSMSSGPNWQTAKNAADSLMGIASDFRLRFEQLLALPKLIVACRHRCASVRGSLAFHFFASTMLSLSLLATAISFLPLLFDFEQVFLTTFVQLPLLTLGSVFTPFHPRSNVIRISSKNTCTVPRQNVIWAVATFFVGFFPTSLFLVLLFFFLLIRNSTFTCSFSDVVCSVAAEHSSDAYLSTMAIRHVVGFHVAFSYASGVFLHEALSAVSMAALVAWTSLIVVVNELVKLRSIRGFATEQRRTKLCFDTKLGMNSPY
ncbi:hypothetical protein OSTOST_05571 [Ostertagia ostertagi]